MTHINIQHTKSSPKWIIVSIHGSFINSAAVSTKLSSFILKYLSSEWISLLFLYKYFTTVTVEIQKFSKCQFHPCAVSVLDMSGEAPWNSLKFTSRSFSLFNQAEKWLETCLCQVKVSFFPPQLLKTHSTSNQIVDFFSRSAKYD